MEKPRETWTFAGARPNPVLFLAPLLGVTAALGLVAWPALAALPAGWLLAILAHQLAVLQGPVLRPLLARWTLALGVRAPAGVAILPERRLLGSLPRAVPGSRLVLVPAGLRQWLADDELAALVDRERARRARAQFPMLLALAVLSTFCLALLVWSLPRDPWPGMVLCLLVEGFRFSVHRLLALDADAAVPARGALSRALGKLRDHADRLAAASLRSRLRRLDEPDAPLLAGLLVRVGFLVLAMPFVSLLASLAESETLSYALRLGLLFWLLRLALTEPADLARPRVVLGSLAAQLVVGALVVLALRSPSGLIRETVFCVGPLALLLSLRLRDPVLAPLARLRRARRRLAGPVAEWLGERSREALDHPLEARLVPVPGGRDFAAAYVPGTRTILIAEPLEQLLSEGELRVLLAREVGRAALRQPRRHLALAALEAAAFGAGYVLAPGDPPFCILAGWCARLPVLPLLAWIEARMVHAADDHAARMTSPADLASALGTLSRWGGRSLVQRHSTEPGYERRIRRLARPA